MRCSESCRCGIYLLRPSFSWRAIASLEKLVLAERSEARRSDNCHALNEKKARTACTVRAELDRGGPDLVGYYFAPLLIFEAMAHSCMTVK